MFGSYGSGNLLVAVLIFNLLSHVSCANYKPTFIGSPVIQVKEDVPIGSTITTLAATDDENDPITFSLDDIGKQILSVVPSNGSLILKEKLDREAKSQYQFKAYAEDNVNGGGPARRVERKLYLQVLDVNDNVPLFRNTPYVVNVAENETVGYVIVQVIATDEDVGNNGAVQYNFSKNQQTSEFSIDNLSGKIKLTGKLDYENVQRYTLFVEAKDGGRPQLLAQASVIITVTDISDNPPKFVKSPYSEDIEENAAKGTEVLKVSAFDGDSGVGNPLLYSITSGNRDMVFNIDNKTGIITVNGKIDAEETPSYTIKVQAVEIPDPDWNTTVEVNIRVLDQNDNPPTFSQKHYHYQVKEDAAQPGYPIIDKFDVTDKDEQRKNNYFEFELSGEESKYFAIDKKTGRLTINSSLDYEKQANYSFYVNATETLSTEKLSGSSSVWIEVLNVNDNNPKFNASLYNYTFDEEVPKGFVIARVTATDEDLGTFGELTYQLKGSDANSFSVTNNGTIITVSVLDYEKGARYEFLLEAKDGGGLFYEKRSSTTIIVNINDINDNTPSFVNLPYTVIVDESLLSSNGIFKVSATDKDSGGNGQVTYSITDGNVGNVFTINQSGLVSTNSPLDHENISLYEVTIMAEDHGSPTRNSTTTLRISVRDLNDNQPVIKRGAWIRVNITEGAGGGTIVYTVEASDEDTGDNGKLTYALVSGANGRFIMNSDTGAIQISPSGLDREIQSIYNLTINVTDRGEPELRATSVVEVQVLDVNDNSPEFQPSPSLSEQAYVVSVEEGSNTLNETILDVNATDKDFGRNADILYSMSGDSNGYFSVNHVTGELMVKKELDREGVDVSVDEQGNARFTLRITATDQAEPAAARKSSTVTITVLVTDTNDNTPAFTNSQYQTSISEAARPGSNVVQVSATDRDLRFAGTVQYNITSGDPNGIFEVSRDFGYIFLKESVDADVISQYNLTVQAADRGNPSLSSTAYVIIKVDDVNDNDPKFNETAYTASVREDANISTSVVSVHATDRDQGTNGEVSYMISSGNTGDVFRVDNVTGVVSTVGLLDRERISKYTLLIQAEDKGHPSTRKAFAEVLIAVVDVNDNFPQFSHSSYEAEVLENSLPSVIVQPKQIVHASDADEGTNAEIVYSLSGVGSSNFVINGSTGVITTSHNSSLDRERNSSFYLQLVATDGGGKFSAVSLIIHLKDANDEAPRFSETVFHFNVSENGRRGATVGRITASDADEGFNKEIIYTSTGADAKFYVSRSTGDIIIDSNLDREFKNLYVLNVTAANIGNNQLEGMCQVYITITDVIDDKPYFAQETITVHIMENASVNTKVTELSALDKDVGDSLTYSVVSGDVYGQFHINNVTGVITTTQELNRENSSQYVLHVQASDSIQLKSDLMKLVVVVDDVNDNAPEFTHSHYVADSWEQSPVGTSIITVKALDIDHGINADVRYSIVENIPGLNISDFVQINSQTGLISQGSKELDRESTPVFNFTVHAEDTGTPPMSSDAIVSINLVDINDNNPNFTRAEYKAFVEENAPVGTQVIVVKAVDRDTGTNAQLAYGMDGDDGFRFQIDRNTGNITTTKVLDREKHPLFTLTVFAQDGAIRHRRGTARLIITVVDDNDHSPVFTQSLYSVAVAENVPVGHDVIKVSATDRDIGANALVSYWIAAVNYGNKFAINGTTGEITTIDKLDRETNSSFSLTITGRDGGKDYRETNTTVLVTITDVNDNIPTFTRPIYNVTFRERTSKGTEIVVVKALDHDEGANGNVRYSVEAGNVNNVFSIDAISGAITLIGELDYETKERFNLTVKASDGATDSPKHGFAFVIVAVIDINDNAPVFDKSSYSVSLLENATLGSFVIQVNATDPDKDVAHKSVAYKIISGNEGNAFVMSGSNGTVSVNPSGPGLDREGKDLYKLQLVVTSRVNNTELQSDPVTLTINVLDVNDVIPTFAQASYSKRIAEDTADNVIVDPLFTFTTADTDLGSNSRIIYSIATGNEEGYFRLDNKTGNLYRAKKIDREHKKSYRLVIVATDQGDPPLSSNTTFDVLIEDRNDNTPIFHGQGNISIAENATIGTVIATLNATDADAGVNSDITYSIVGGNTGGEFQLDSSTGVLTTAKKLDYEATPEYELTIQAEDRGSVPRSEIKKLKIIVTNINDNEPTFTKRRVTLTVDENLPGNTVIGTVAAIDDDKNPIYYYIISGNENNVFALNATTGVLKTTRTVDREDSARYLLYIKSSNSKLDPANVARKRRAVDSSNSSKVAPEPDNPAVQLVVVEIGDKNDNPPRFTKREYTGGVSEDAKYGSNVVRVTAVDTDAGNNSLIAYSLINGTGFNVDKESGWITAKDSYAGKSGTEYFLFILAQDNFGAVPAYNDTTKVKIYVLTDNKRVMLISGVKDVDLVRNNKEEFARVLSKVTGYTVNIDDVNYHKLENGAYDKSKVDVLFHAVDPKTNKLVDKDTVISMIDKNYHTEDKFFTAWKIYEVKPKVPNKQTEEFNITLAILIGLAVLLLLVIFIFCCVIWKLRKRQERKLRAATAASYGSGPSQPTSMASLPTTNLHIAEGSNPIWVDPYHNWGMTSDDDVETVDRYQYNGKSQVPRAGNPLFESQEVSMDLFKENEDKMMSKREPRSSSIYGVPSPEPYESSPTNSNVYYDPDDPSIKYEVTEM